MKDRLLTLALAVGAFVAFYALMFPKPAPQQQRVTRPLSTEAGPNGYLALQRWLAAEQVPTLSLRERYGELAAVTAAAPTGNLLITTTPHVYPLRNSEAEPLSDWIASGNTMLVLASLSDTPEWAIGENAAFLEHMKLMTGLSFIDTSNLQPGQEGAPTPGTENSSAQQPGIQDESPEGAQQDAQEGMQEDTQEGAAQQQSAPPRNAIEAARQLIEPQRFDSAPNGPHPLLDGVQSIVALSEYPAGRWRAFSDDALLLELASERASGTPALWLLQHGEGQIIVSAFGSVLTNKLLGESDNARLLANLVHWSLGGPGRVIFDDAHQGLVSFYDPEKFFGDSRLHRTLWWLVALWLVFVLGPRALRPAGSAWNPVDVTSFVRATAGFMARVLKPAAAGQRLFANFFNEIRHRLALEPDGTPVWEWLGAHAAIPATDLRRLRELHERVSQRRRVNLPELNGLLARVRSLLN